MITDRDSLIINALQSNLDGINDMYEATDELGQPIWDQSSLLKDKDNGIAALAAYLEELQSQPPAKPWGDLDIGLLAAMMTGRLDDDIGTLTMYLKPPAKPEPRGDALEALYNWIETKHGDLPASRLSVEERQEIAAILASSQWQGDAK